MAKAIDLDKDPIKQTFSKYLLPAIFGMIIKSIFIIADAAFVGHGVGTTGLGAIAFTVPFFSFSSAVAMMVGIGGAAMMSIEFGKKNHRVGQRIFVQAMAFIFIISAILVATGLFWLEDIVYLLGARGDLAAQSIDYLAVMLFFFMVHAPSWVLSCFVRNDTNPSLAMYAMVSGAIANIILDYLFIFVFGWGIQGAALATGLSQTMIFFLLLTHFSQGHGLLKLSFSGLGLDKIRSILTMGLPVFFIESTTAITTVVFNYILIKQFSELHVTAYGIVMNVALVVVFLMVGIGQACQPIISYNHGAGKIDRVRQTLFLGLRYSVIIGTVATAIALVGAEWIAAFFTAYNPALIELTASAMRIYFLAPVLIGLNLMTATLFQSIENPNKASVLSLSRGFVFVLVGLLTLPLLFPEHGVWGSVLLAEAVTAIISLVMLRQFLIIKPPQAEPVSI